MKAFLIALALIAAGFAAVVVYGVTRDRPAAPAGGTPDPDALEDWRPPDAVSALGGISRRYGPGLKERDRLDVAVPGGFRIERRPIPPDGDEPRVAKLRLVSGTAARVTVEQVGERENSACLCRPGATPTPDDLQGCRPRWVAERTGPTGCLEGAEENGLPLTGAAATLSFASARGAGVRVR